MISFNHNFQFSGSIIPNVVAIDTESDGLSPYHGARMFSAAAAFQDGQTAFWRGSDLYGGGLRRILEDPNVDKLFWNAKHDVRMLEWSGFKTIRGKVWDGMIFAHLLNGRMTGSNLGLGPTAIRYLPSGRRKIIDEITQYFDEHRVAEEKRVLSFGILPPDLLMRRNIGDAQITLDLFMRMYKTVALTFPWLLKNEHRLIPVVKKMEDKGVQIDYDEIDIQIDYFHEIYEYVENFFQGILGRENTSITTRREEQIEALTKAGLYDLITEKTKTGKKLDDWNLRQLHHPIAHMLLLGKAAVKMRDTFLEGIKRQAVNGILHGNFNQLGTTTGRFSSSNPNLQNIPIEGDRRTSYTEDEAAEAFEMTGINYAPHIKRVFTIREGECRIHSDKTQAEMFMMGHYADDPKMDAIFLDSIKTGKSIHDLICVTLYNEWTKGLKTRTKAVVFGYQYGAGNDTLAKKIGSTVLEAIKTRNLLARKLPGLPRWKRRLDEIISEQGFVITEHGRRHYLKESESYISINRMCQGSVGDEIKSRMVALNDYYEAECPEACLVLNVHDDLATDAPIEERHRLAPQIHRIMEETGVPFRLPMPSSLDITYTRWSDLKEIKRDEPFPEPPDGLLARHRPRNRKSRLGVS